MNILFQFICIVTTQTSPKMCKCRPTNNEGQEISSSNTEVGLINFSAEEWSLDKPQHRTEVATSLLLIILLLFGAYKLRKRCLKKKQRRSNSNEPPSNPHYNLNILPNQPPTPAHGYQHGTYQNIHSPIPTYETIQHKHDQQPPETKPEPMPYNIMAMLAQNKSENIHSE